MDSHTVGIYGVLLAVVLVGVVGLYFTSMAGNETSVVYVGGGYQAPQVTAWTPPFYSKLAEISKPFMIRAKGITGLEFYRQGTATITCSNQSDLRMPKRLIVCNASLAQEWNSTILYTCGDNVSMGGLITCDINGSGANSQSYPTTASTCNATAAALNLQGGFGAFVVCNHGKVGQLNATLVNLTVGNITNYDDIHLDNILYNAVDNDPGKGCVGLCNNCNKTEADAGNCDKYLNTSLGNQSKLECDYFDTSGQCVCECFSIHIDDEDDLHALRNGETLEFVVEKRILDPPAGFVNNSNCT